MLLKVAYVIDQDGMLLGLAYNQAYGDLLHQANPLPATSSGGNDGDDDNDNGAAAAEEEEAKIAEESNPGSNNNNNNSKDTATATPKNDHDGNNNNNHDDNNNNNLPLQLEFFVLPGETRQVRVKALYSENPVEADTNKDILDVCLVEGPWISLADVVATQEKRRRVSRNK